MKRRKWLDHVHVIAIRKYRKIIENVLVKNVTPKELVQWEMTEEYLNREKECGRQRDRIKWYIISCLLNVEEVNAGGGPLNLSIYSYKRERKDRRKQTRWWRIRECGYIENRTFKRMTKSVWLFFRYTYKLIEMWLGESYFVGSENIPSISELMSAHFCALTDRIL